MHWIWPRKTIADIETNIAVRFGRLMHWAALAFAGLLWLGEFVGIIFGYWSSSFFDIGIIVLIGIAAIMIGRGLRYVFSNE